MKNCRPRLNRIGGWVGGAASLYISPWCISYPLPPRPPSRPTTLAGCCKARWEDVKGLPQDISLITFSFPGQTYPQPFPVIHPLPRTPMALLPNAIRPLELPEKIGLFVQQRKHRRVTDVRHNQDECTRCRNVSCKDHMSSGCLQVEAEDWFSQHLFVGRLNTRLLAAVHYSTRGSGSERPFLILLKHAAW